PRWTRRSSPGRRSNRTSSATSATVTRASSTRARRALASRRRARWFERVMSGDAGRVVVEDSSGPAEPGGRPHQVADVPAVAARQESDPQERPPHPAPPDRVARVAGEDCEGTGWQRGGLVFFRTEQTGCKKGLRLLRSGPLTSTRWRKVRPERRREQDGAC